MPEIKTETSDMRMSVFREVNGFLIFWRSEKYRKINEKRPDIYVSGLDKKVFINLVKITKMTPNINKYHQTSCFLPSEFIQC